MNDQLDRLMMSMTIDDDKSSVSDLDLDLYGSANHVNLTRLSSSPPF
jgi:hypothetical protein